MSAQCPYDHEDEDEDGYCDESDHCFDEESDNDEPYPEHVPALSFALRPFWGGASLICAAGRITNPRVGPRLYHIVLRLATTSELSPIPKRDSFTLLVLQDRRSSWFANPLFSDTGEYLPRSS
jgi:hypothetical protein